MKGVLEPDHIAVNKYVISVIGMPTLTAVSISGIEDELETVDLPDRTVSSGGSRLTGEWTMGLPMHHLVEQAAMEVWYLECQDPVTPTYKKIGTLLHKSNSGAIIRSYSLVGLFPYKRKLPDLEMENEGEMAIVEWGMKHSDMVPI